MNDPRCQETEPLTRLRIPHLFIWMFASAVLLTALRQVNHYYVGQSGDQLSAGLRQYFGLMFAFTAITGGAGLLAVVLGIQRRRLNQRAFTAPGHWLLLIMLVQAINDALVVPTAFWLQQNINTVHPRIFAGVLSIGNLMTIAFAIVAWKRFPQLFVWRAFFLLEVLPAMTGCLMNLGLGLPLTYSALTAVVRSVTTLVFFVAVGTDLIAKRYWDWLHWIGVILQVSAAALGVVSILLI